MPIQKKGSGILGSIILIVLAVVLIASISRDIIFYFNKSITKVNSPADFDKLHDNALAEISLDLDFKDAYAISYLSQREFVLIPFSGLGYKLMYVVEGPLSDKLPSTLVPPYKGRVVGKDFGDSWEVYDKPIKLAQIFARDRIELPKGTLLVYDAPKEFPGIWQIILLTLSIFYLAYKAISLVRHFQPAEKAPNAAA